jgi:pimeloyl-ACP methyl ester carboxylesterase
LPEAGGVGATPPPGLELLFDTALRFDFPWWLGTRVARSWLIRTVLATPPELVAAAGPEETAAVSIMLESVLPVSQRRLGLLNDARVTTDMRRPDLERVRVPTLLVSAEDDLYATYERARYTAGEIAGAKFVGYPTGGHLLVGRGAEVRAEVARLLEPITK